VLKKFKLISNLAKRAGGLALLVIFLLVSIVLAMCVPLVLTLLTTSLKWYVVVLMDHLRRSVLTAMNWIFPLHGVLVNLDGALVISQVIMLLVSTALTATVVN